MATSSGMPCCASQPSTASPSRPAGCFGEIVTVYAGAPPMSVGVAALTFTAPISFVNAPWIDDTEGTPSPEAAVGPVGPAGALVELLFDERFGSVTS